MTKQLYITDRKGYQFVVCSRSVRVDLTRLALRLLNRSSLHPEHQRSVVAFMQRQLEFKDWTPTHIEELDAAMRSTRSRRLDVEFVAFDSLSKTERGRRPYTALRATNGATLDMNTIIADAAKGEIEEPLALLAQYGLRIVDSIEEVGQSEDLTGLNQRIAALEKQTTAQDTEIAALRAQLAEQQAMLSAVMERINAPSAQTAPQSASEPATEAPAAKAEQPSVFSLSRHPGFIQSSRLQQMANAQRRRKAI